MKEIHSIIRTIKALSKREGTWRLVAALSLWVVIIAVFAIVISGNGKQLLTNLRGYNTGQVAGEKTAKNEAADSAQATKMPNPQVTPIATPNSSTTPMPTAKPLQTSAQSTNSPVKESVSNGDNSMEPSHTSGPSEDKNARSRVLEGGQQLNLEQGSLKFRFTYDGVEEEMDLFLGNYDGQGRSNVMVVTFAFCSIGFDTYDNSGQSTEGDFTVSLGDDCAGKTFDLEFKWNFVSQPPVKRIYVNGELRLEDTVMTVPSVANPQILTRYIQDIVISDKFE